MAWTNITKPAVGDPTKKQAFADVVVDDLTYLYNQFLSLVGSREIIVNGSFESDADADGYPDGWTRTLYTGGSFTFDLSTSAADGKAIHGKRSVKFTSPGGVGNGGGYLESTDFFEISENRTYVLSWQHKSSAAGIHNLVEITFYDSTQASLSTSTLYDSAANATGWTLARSVVIPPANARYAKIRLTGAKNDNTTAGSAWFDNVQINPLLFEHKAEFTNTGTAQWTAPAGVRFIEARVIGGGGGGGSTNSGASASGGGGGEAYVLAAVTPGTAYAITVGAGGTVTALNNGGAGGSSTLVIGGTTYTGGGGGGGSSGAGAGGAGGTATNGTVNTTGVAGGARSGSVGGNPGYAPNWGMGANPAPDNTNGTAGPQPGGGGSGNGGSAATLGGVGGAGMVVIRW